MLTKFWEGLGSQIAERLVGRLFSPALIFWLGGFIAWASRQGGAARVLSEQSKSWGAAPVPTQVLLLVVGFLGLVASSTAMRQAQPYLQRLLEGDWPRGMRRLPQRYVYGLVQKREHLTHQYEALRLAQFAAMARGERVGAPSLEQIGEIRLKLQRLPRDPARMRPTRLGNILQVADARPLYKYGLEATTVWPVLWQVMTAEERHDVGQSRAGLERNIEAWGWATLFVVWTPWAWWAAPASLVASSAIYYASILSAAQIYGQLLEASFDLYRMKLYRALALPLPPSSAEEGHCGELLTRFLQGDSPRVEYHHLEPASVPGPRE
ncbi:uS14 family ribosomal protein [Streptomyces echinatus]|uniref:hypothetical protein n=1 Tax=Streptomyces echinatus TaxID=67293 RepID=UPI00382D19A4